MPADGPSPGNFSDVQSIVDRYANMGLHLGENRPRRDYGLWISCGVRLSDLSTAKTGILIGCCLVAKMGLTEMANVPIDPLKIFIHAFRFLKSEEHLRRTEDPQMMAFVGLPSIVLSAFASELFFKCIHVLETGSAPMGHNLFTLFKGLKSSTQKRITKRWDVAVASHEKTFVMNEAMSGKKISRDFPGALQSCARAFEGMRYIYEDPMKTNFYLIDLPRILHAEITETKPEWRGMGPSPAKEMKP